MAKVPSRDQAALGRKLAERMSAQGFTAPAVVSAPNWELYLYRKQSIDNSNLYIGVEGDFCACSGTLLHESRIGLPALERLYHDFNPDCPFVEALHGAFCVIIRKAARMFLFVDRLGIYKVYRNQEATVFSSSLLATLASVERPVVIDQSVYEYVFEGATHGNDTIVEAIRLVECDALYRLDAPASITPMPGQVSRHVVNERLENHLERNLENLRRSYTHITTCFGNRIDTALSGGYDSRLTLALLRERGVRPKVHVYGRADDDDVRVARAIDAGENLGLAHIDKSKTSSVAADAADEVVERNFYAFDGCPPDGIFTGSADLATRRDRCREGEVMLNGGGGEIFRNFFHLRDARFTVEALLWSFYSQFDPRVCTGRFSERDYHRRLAEKMKKTLGITRDTLYRHEIELLYPLFRCRFWMGQNNSINNRLGYALTPFIDHTIVRAAVTIPVKYKDFGRFEARLIRAVDPRLAAYPSSYGHDFLRDPPRKRIAKDLGTHLRPCALRRRIYRLRSRLRPARESIFLAARGLSTILNEDFPYMRHWFHIRAIRDPQQFNRVCTLEYLFQKLRPDLPDC